MIIYQEAKKITDENEEDESIYTYCWPQVCYLFMDSNECHDNNFYK